MRPPYVTALINTYNYGRFVGEAIESVLAQEFPPGEMEVLVVDDGSTDDTPERVAKFGDRVRYLRKLNGGQASAINVGFRNSRGQIIALLDADDLWNVNKLARVVEEFEKNPAAGMVYHGLTMWAEAAETPWKSFEFSSFVTGYHPTPGDFAKHLMIPTSALSFRRSELNKVMPIPEDVVIMMDRYLVALMPFVAPVVSIAEPLTKYRVHSNNAHFFQGRKLDKATVNRRVDSEQRILEGIERWLSQNNLNELDPAVAHLLKILRFCVMDSRVVFNKASRVELYSFLRMFDEANRKSFKGSYNLYRRLVACTAFVLGCRIFNVLRKSYESNPAFMRLRERIIPAALKHAANKDS